MPTIQRIIPVLVYRDIQAAHDFLVGAFGFEPVVVERAPDGEIVHGEVRSGEFRVWLHRVVPDLDLASPGDMDVTSGGLVVHVDDVDAHFEHAKAHGARIEREPTDAPYGQREYGARDPEDHRWWFATPLT